MPSISLTDFIDFAASSGLPKMTKVNQIKTRPPYEPAFDYYKRVREAIQACHQEGGGRTKLDSHLGSPIPDKKRENYALVVAGYKRWWGRKKLEWFDPPRGEFKASGITVRVNPELGLRVNGVPYLIKLYFKADKLTKSRIQVITHLMDEVLAAHSEPGYKMAVLDVRNGKLHCPTVPVPTLSATLKAELAYMASAWKSI